jgi:uncharacterized membrane protein
MGSANAKEAYNMSTRLTHIVVLLVLAGAIVAGIVAYPRLPAEVVTHWNAAGEPNGYGSRLVGVALMPAITLLMYVLFLLIPQIDPLKHNIASFRGYFNGFIAAIVLFMAYLQGLTLALNLGVQFNLSAALMPALGALFYIAGSLVGHARPNWFIGLRTPWTLSNEEVWNRTHRLGAVLFKILGVLTVLSIFLPGQWALWVVVGFALLVAVWSFVYSYWAYTQVTRRDQ